MAGNPIMSIIKNDSMGNMLCYKVPCEDFNIGSQLIVAEYEEALFMKDGVIEEVFGGGRYTLTTENYPFLTKLVSRLISGGVSAYSCKVFYINKAHHLNLKWGTGVPIRILDPVLNIDIQVQARGAYTVQVKNGKKFFLKMVGANTAAAEEDIVKNFRAAFVQNITDELAAYLTSGDEEVMVVLNRKKALADSVKAALNDVLDEYGMELINFYIENISIPENDPCMQAIREMRIQRRQKMFEREQNLADERLRFGIRREEAETERYVSGQFAQADYERMKIRDQDGNNGWARQEAADILKSAVANEGNGSLLMQAGIGLGLGTSMGGMAGNMVNQMYGRENQSLGQDPAQGPGQEGAGKQTRICPKCGSAVPEGMKFCGICGSPMEPPKRICAGCGAEIPEGMRFCGQCGMPVAPQKRFCSQCGAELMDGMKFCGICGHKEGE